jgi:uncharacterized PurR-regulated membrane protein YhhQ (DUF165 family)
MGTGRLVTVFSPPFVLASRNHFGDNGLMVARATTSRWSATLRSIVAGLAVFILGSLSDVWLRHGTSLLFSIIDAR